MREDYYYGHGKLLLTSEYFVLDGAKSIALPTKLGQRMHVRYRPSNKPKLTWKSFDNQNQCWFTAEFELWHFDLVGEINPEALFLQNILKNARAENIHFLRDNYDVHVSTVLEFPLCWGLGSSSTLIYNIAQWAYISPFKLQQNVLHGSGYDIACAQSMGPITYSIQNKRPEWGTINFNPVFKNHLFFVYTNQKQSTPAGIDRYEDLVKQKDNVINQLNDLTNKILDCVDHSEFNDLICEHENIISAQLDLPTVKSQHFHDFKGEMKSLGAWGGDFILASSQMDLLETKTYFSQRGFPVVLSFDELVLQNFQKYGEVLNHGNDEFTLQSL